MSVVPLLVKDVTALNALTDVFVAAFTDDPGMGYLCQAERDGYPQRLRHWFRASLGLQIANQQPLFALTCEGQYVAGVALTVPNTTLRAMSVTRWLGTTWRGAGWRSVWRTIHHLQRLSNYQPTKPHFRLEFLAVNPSQQGKGYGRVLLEAIHHLASPMDIWLETTNPTNVPLYKRFGYVVTHRVNMGPAVDAIMMVRGETA
ncbi:MAG TPA: GNAT family N-acetyltransferase [Aggregatilineales bacterium]|nr:GNAT family N-acetyltransferase [Aggregatilineales bacterium]